jgi:hypothetical protein
MPTKSYVGIDCGKSGAVALIVDGKVRLMEFTPVVTTRTRKRKRSKSNAIRYSSSTQYNLKEMLNLLRKCLFEVSLRDLLVTIEQQRQRPHDSKQTVFQVGYGQGLWEMACTALDLPFTTVEPAVWKPNYVEKGAEKSASVTAASALYKVNFTHKKDEAKAEAILIADYQRRKQESLGYPRNRA